MLKISRLTDYGTVILSQMALKQAQRYTASDLAKVTGIALPTVAKLLKLLAGNGILSSYRGSSGGYVLARNPEAISVADIINTLDGPIALTECATGESYCEFHNNCNLKQPWRYVNSILTTTLKSITLDKIINNDVTTLKI